MKNGHIYWREKCFCKHECWKNIHTVREREKLSSPSQQRKNKYETEKIYIYSSSTFIWEEFFVSLTNRMEKIEIYTFFISMSLFSVSVTFWNVKY